MELKTANLKVIDQWERGFYLVELGSRDFETTLKDLPMRRGALAFEDGNAKTSLKFEEKRRRSARILTPESFASIRWGSTAKDQIRMKDDVEKFSKMKGIHAELINSMLGKKVYGNLNYLKLTPEKGVTLLEVFLKTRAGFYYKQVDVSDESPSKKADPNNKTKTKT